MKTHRAYLFLGPETGNKNEALDRLKKDLEADFQEPPEIHKLYAFDSTVESILSLLRTGSLFAAHTLVLVGSTEEFSKKDDIKALANYIAKPNPDATLVLLSDQIKLDTSLHSAASKPAVQVFWEMFENQKKGWVIKTFKEQGNNISPEAAEYFLEMVENKTDALRREAQRVSLFLGPGTPIELPDLEKFLDHSREENVFNLFEKMAEGNLETALETLRKILLSSNPGAGIGLLAGIAFQLRRVIGFKSRLHQHPDPNSVFKELRIFGKKNQKTIRIADRSWTESRCQDLLVLIEEYEARMRLYRTDMQKLLLELFIIQAMVGAGKIAPPPVWFFPRQSLV